MCKHSFASTVGKMFLKATIPQNMPFSQTCCAVSSFAFLHFSDSYKFCFGLCCCFNLFLDSRWIRYNLGDDLLNFCCIKNHEGLFLQHMLHCPFFSIIFCLAMVRHFIMLARQLTCAPDVPKTFLLRICCLLGFSSSEPFARVHSSYFRFLNTSSRSHRSSTCFLQDWLIDIAILANAIFYTSASSFFVKRQNFLQFKSWLLTSHNNLHSLWPFKRFLASSGSMFLNFLMQLSIIAVSIRIFTALLLSLFAY